MNFACRVEDVPIGEGRRLTIAGRQVALFRTATGWHAIDHVCPHAGGPLADGIAADCTVICPLHERRFALDSGEPVGHEGPGVKVHTVTILGDRVMVALGAPMASQAA